MRIYNCLLALAGDTGNTVPKANITAAEIALLQAIHGTGSVIDIEDVGSVKRSNREERGHLFDTYAKPQPTGDRLSRELDTLFPGIAARLPESVEELDLDDSFFKPTARANTKAAAPEPESAPAPKARRSKKAAEPEPAPADDDGDEDDGIGEIPGRMFE